MRHPMATTGLFASRSILFATALYIVTMAPSLFNAQASNARIAFLYCPDGGGICSWDRTAGWKVVFEPEDPGQISDFFQASDDSLVVLLCGHMEPGRILVIGSSGRFLKYRKLPPTHLCENLNRIMVETPSEDLVFCDESGVPLSFEGPGADGQPSLLVTQRTFCGDWLPHGSRTPSDEPPQFPSECDFPRYLDNETPVCFRREPRDADLDGGLQLLSLNRAGRLDNQPIPLVPRTSISDIRILGRSAITIRSLNNLYVWDGQSTSQLDDHVFWTRRIGDFVYYSSCEYTDGALTPCFLKRIDKKLGARVLWQSETQQAVTVVEYEKGAILVDVWGNGVRQLVKLRTSSRRTVETVLWSHRSKRWD